MKRKIKINLFISYKEVKKVMLAWKEIYLAYPNKLNLKYFPVIFKLSY